MAKDLQQKAQEILAQGPILLSDKEYNEECRQIATAAQEAASPHAQLGVLQALHYLTFNACGCWPGGTLDINGQPDESMRRYLPENVVKCVRRVEQLAIILGICKSTHDAFGDFVDGVLAQIDALRNDPPACPLTKFRAVMPNIAALLP